MTWNSTGFSNVMSVDTVSDYNDLEQGIFDSWFSYNFSMMAPSRVPILTIIYNKLDFVGKNFEFVFGHNAIMDDNRGGGYWL